MLSFSKTLDVAISIGSATARLTDTILGNDNNDLAETLEAIASEIGLTHIAYFHLSPGQEHRRLLFGLGRNFFEIMAATILFEEIFDP